MLFLYVAPIGAKNFVLKMLWIEQYYAQIKGGERY